MLSLRISHTSFCFKLFVCIAITNLSGCREKPSIPKEGDIVVWKHNSELIIKARLGQRREHVIVDSRTDHFFYEPEYERFIGQFPIDYKPKPFPKFTEQEQIAFEAEHATKIHAVKSGHPIEFNLMLNGVEAKATDNHLHGGNRKMDDPNQVKVILHGYGAFPVVTKSGVKRAPYNTQQYFERELMKELDISSKESNYGIDCYLIKDGKDGKGGKRCFGKSTISSISGFKFYMSPTFKSKIRVTSIELIYAGFKVEWFTAPRNINRAREIDAAIWSLLEAWNISSVTTPIQNNH